MNKNKKKGFNQEQLKAIANILLDFAKSLFLAMTVAVLIPGIGGKIELDNILFGAVISLSLLILGIFTLKEVKDE